MITKKNVQKGDAVKIRFQLPAEHAQQSVAIVGNFNDWDETKDLMKLSKKDGTWSRTLTLEPGREVQFRYLIDGSQWYNDEDADRYLANAFGTENAVLVL
ncbi:MAG TPA: isoamylase early set domain-containing protein [Rhodothermales bacterium]|nr:isoamylase early set domain-containing protein [Rhodothermales bacterium]